MNLHRLGSWWQNTQAGASYVEPPAELDTLSATWIDSRTASRQIREVRKTWYQEHLAERLEPLDMIQWEVRGGDSFYQPYPDVVLAKSGDLTVGVLSGNPNQLYKHFFIDGIALHPAYDLHLDHQRDIVSTLLEAAIDFSQAMGFRGWVACHHDIHHLDLLRERGFYPHDDFTYRKMGYFS